MNIIDLIKSHRPKYVKYKYIFKDDELLVDLYHTPDFDSSILDTILDDELVQKALECNFHKYERDTIAKAKQPTILDNGIILSKKLITKADKKLEGIYVGTFEFRNILYVSMKFKYEFFDILEIFILT